MAIRPVFILNSEPPYFKTIDIEFKYEAGFAITQKQKNIANLHNAFLTKYHNHKILEISTKSTDFLGIQLSAFNLTLSIDSIQYPIENLYQSSKIYDFSEQQIDILKMSPSEAKKISNYNKDKKLTGFKFLNFDFPLEPKNYFYNWLYINALVRHKDLLQQLLDSGYNAFSDIEFNPKKSFNCQAQALAIGMSLLNMNIIFNLYKDKFIDKDAFLKTVYKDNIIIYNSINLSEI